MIPYPVHETLPELDEIEFPTFNELDGWTGSCGCSLRVFPKYSYIFLDKPFVLTVCGMIGLSLINLWGNHTLSMVLDCGIVLGIIWIAFVSIMCLLHILWHCWNYCHQVKKQHFTSGITFFTLNKECFTINWKELRKCHTQVIEIFSDLP